MKKVRSQVGKQIVKGNKSVQLLSIKRNVAGAVQFQAVGSASIDGTPATGTTTLVTEHSVFATSVTVSTAAGTNFSGTLLRNGVTLTSGAGVTTLATSTLLDTPLDAPVSWTLQVTATAGTPTVNINVNREDRLF